MALGLLFAAAPALGESGGVSTFPQGVLRPKHGLRLEIDTRWINASGYRPVRLTVATWPPVPSTSVRTLRIELHPQSNRSHWHPHTTSANVELPQGAVSATTTLYVPQDSAWHQFQVETFEDGRKLDELSGWMPMNNQRHEWTEANPACLFIDADAPVWADRARIVTEYQMGGAAAREKKKALLPDIRAIAAAIPNSSFHGQRFTESNDAEILSLLQQGLERVEVLPPSELPEHTLGYTCFDLAFVSWDDLRGMVKQNTPRTRALLDWVRAGATLCVYGVGTRYERLKELEAELKLPPAPEGTDTGEPGAGEPGAAGRTWRGWLGPAVDQPDADDIQRLFQQQQQQQPVRASRTPPKRVTEDRATAAKPATLEAGPAFVHRPWQFGRLVAIGSANPFTESNQRWQSMFVTLGPERLLWYQRHGLSWGRENRDYWRLLIPGVGLPPVWAFIVLISLFVIAIGPVNYLLLKRMRRLFLLLVTVPAGAAIVTGALMAYAIAVDGLGVRLRVRSLTRLDQRQQHAVSWSWQTYYASVQPSRGLAFPEDAVVLPLDRNPMQSNRRRHRERRFGWQLDGPGQQLAEGYLSPREMEEFLVVRSRTNDRHGLNVQEKPGGPPQVANELGARVERLFVRAADGKYYSAASLAENARAALEPCSLEDVRREVRKLIRQHELEEPPGFDAQLYNQYAIGGWRWYGGPEYDQGASAPTIDTSVLERELTALRNGTAPIEPRSYIAFAAASPEVAVGVRHARQEQSLHVIEGAW